MPDVNPTGKYSTVETHRALGISYNTLMRYVEKGYIRANVGRVRRYFVGAEIIRCWKMV